MFIVSFIFLRVSGIDVDSVINVISLNNLLYGLHLFDLGFPSCFILLFTLVEQLLVWFPVTVTNSIPKSGELTIVVVEVQVVDCVASSTVDDGIP